MKSDSIALKFQLVSFAFNISFDKYSHQQRAAFSQTISVHQIHFRHISLRSKKDTTSHYLYFTVIHTYV